MYAAVSARSLERLERGQVRPQARTAHALAKALEIAVSDLFPLGVSDQVQNPEGVTRIPERRPPRGKAKNKA
jgi:DNA-binding XRE family transcriptional regulator